MQWFKICLLHSFFFVIPASFEHYCALESVNFIPFIVRIATDSLDCWGVILSTTTLLVNQGCIDGTTRTPIHLITHDRPANDLVAVQSFTLHSGLNDVLPEHSKNDWALLSLPFPLKFTKFLQPVHFTSDSVSKNKNYSTVVFKAGRLTTAPVQIQEDKYCRRVYGDKFESNVHYCVIAPDNLEDDLLTIIKDSVAHLMLNEGNLVGLILPGTINGRLGKIYRILKISSVINWLKDHTALTYATRSENISCDSTSFNSLTGNTIKHLVEDFLKETLQKNLDFDGSDLRAEFQRELNKVTLLVAQSMDARFIEAQKYVGDMGKEILKNIDEREVAFRKSLSEKQRRIEVLEFNLKMARCKLVNTSLDPGSCSLDLPLPLP